MLRRSMPQNLAWHTSKADTVLMTALHSMASPISGNIMSNGRHSWQMKVEERLSCHNRRKSTNLRQNTHNEDFCMEETVDFSDATTEPAGHISDFATGELQMLMVRPQALRTLSHLLQPTPPIQLSNFAKVCLTRPSHLTSSTHTRHIKIRSKTRTRRMTPMTHCQVSPTAIETFSPTTTQSRRSPSAQI